MSSRGDRQRRGTERSLSGELAHVLALRKLRSNKKTKPAARAEGAAEKLQPRLDGTVPGLFPQQGQGRTLWRS